MAGDIKQKYGSSAAAITITIAPGSAGLADAAARESTHLNNETDLFVDALVGGKVKTGDTGVSTTGYCNIYAYATCDGGTTFTDTCTGSDAAVTLTSPPNVKLIGVINCVANATTYEFGPFSVAAAFGGVLPAEWGIVIENKTGHHLDNTEASHDFWYQGIYGQYT